MGFIIFDISEFVKGEIPEFIDAIKETIAHIESYKGVLPVETLKVLQKEGYLHDTDSCIFVSPLDTEWLLSFLRQVSEMLINPVAGIQKQRNHKEFPITKR